MIKTFKLITGEELIANIDSSDDDFITCSDVMTLQVGADPKTGQPVQGFANWPALAALGQKVKFPVKSLLTSLLEPHSELADYFRQATTGIVVPKNSIIHG